MFILVRNIESGKDQYINTSLVEQIQFTKKGATVFFNSGLIVKLKEDANTLSLITNTNHPLK